MPNVNKCIFIGNLTASPELKTVVATSVCKFSLAVNRKWKNSEGKPVEETMFIDVNAWGKVAEIIHKHTDKGDCLYVEGYLRLEQWEATNGEKQRKHSLTLENFQFVSTSTKPKTEGKQTDKPASEPPPSDDDEPDEPF